MDAPLLEMRDISKHFPGVLALDHVSFDPRERVVLRRERVAARGELRIDRRLTRRLGAHRQAVAARSVVQDAEHVAACLGDRRREGAGAVALQQRR